MKWVQLTDPCDKERRIWVVFGSICAMRPVNGPGGEPRTEIILSGGGSILVCEPPGLIAEAIDKTMRLYTADTA